MSLFSEVPSKVDFPELERKTLEFWRKNRCFETLVEKNRGGEPWSFLDGPITANNPMGVHHAWGRTYKDIFQRYHAMLGHDQRYQNGFDCQGLWVEVEVEKELQFTSKTDIERYGIAEFVEKCKERVRRFSAIQTQQSTRLGQWMDWDNSYFTMSDENNYTIWAFLKRCHEKGWIYKGRDAMPWCGRCGTGLSQHEIATEGYRQLTHVSPYIRLELAERPGEYLLVWTTTPWTLTSNVACAVHPDKSYLRVRQGDAIYYLIEGRKDILKEKGKFEVVSSLLGKEMLGWRYSGPFHELSAQADVVHRVIPWSEVTETEGTGIVHIAPGCGKEDFALSGEFGLAVIAPLNELGHFVEGFGDFSGKSAADVSAEVLEQLRLRDILYKRERYTHSYPVCWRCGSELLFRLVDEWFIDMGERLPKDPGDVTATEKASRLRYQIMDTIGDIEWIPSYGYEREMDWLLNMQDWMISKKRFWGLALPIFQCHDCGKFEVIGGHEELKARAIEGWEEFDGHSPHRPWVDGVLIACSHCQAPIRRIPDVGNPWLDAGIVPFSTLKWGTDRQYWEKWFPAHMVTESFPGQFRNWFYSLLAMSTVMAGRAPFKTLLGYALMRATDGREMHKSWGNSIEFNEAADRAGVDPMRWLFAAHNPEQNLLFGYGSVDEARRKFLVLWNVYSFFVTYARIDGFDPSSSAIPVKERNVLDRWILGSLQDLIEAAHEGYGRYKLPAFMRQVQKFIDNLSTWYVRRSRRRFWKSEDDHDKLAAYQTLYGVLVTIVELLAPIIPFITEGIYQNLVRSWDKQAPVSVHHRGFPKANPSLVDQKLNRRMKAVLETVEAGRSARQKVGIKVRQPLSRILVHLDSDVSPGELGAFESQILDELNVKAIEFRDSLSGFLTTTVKLNAKKAGPRLGKLMKKAMAAMRLVSAETAAAGMSAGSLSLPCEGGAIEILPQEVLIEQKPKEGFAFAKSGAAEVLVDTTLTDDLRQEGLVRDLIRQVQDLRKEAKLEVADRIELVMDGPEEVQAAVRAFEETLIRETLTEKLSFGTPNDGMASRSVSLKPHKLRVALKKMGG